MSDQNNGDQRNLPSPLAEAEAKELLAVVNRARKGDHAVVPRLRQILAARPQIWEHYGNLGRQVRMAWIVLAAGNDLHHQECLRWRAADMHRELVGGSTNRVVRLMAERVVLAWLQACYFDGIEVKALNKPEGLPLLNYRAKRASQAGRQYLMALAAFATLRKLLPDDGTLDIRLDGVRPPTLRLIEISEPRTVAQSEPQVDVDPAVEQPVPAAKSKAESPRPRRRVQRTRTNAGEPVTPAAEDGSSGEHRVGPRVRAASAPPTCQAAPRRLKSKPRRSRKRSFDRKPRRRSSDSASATT